MATFSPKIYIPLVLLFLGAFAWLWHLKADTGIPWDEPWQQNLGVKSFNYATGKNDALLSIQNRYHGGSFETVLEGTCRMVGAYGFAQKVQVRRTVLVFFFLVGALFLFLTAAELTGSGYGGLLAVLMLFFTPRIMVHAAINSKDLPLLSVGTFFLWAGLRYWKNPQLLYALICGIAAGAMVSLRIPAVYVLGMWVFLWGGTWFREGVSKKRQGVTLSVFLLVAALCTYAFWPVLWGNPLFRFGEAWSFMSHFPWDNEVLFMGEFISARDLPPTYIPVWMGITIPPVWSLFFLCGLFVGALFFVRHWRENIPFVFLAGYVIVPIAAVVVLKSAVYDEWRHLFFVYPGLLLIAVWGIFRLSTVFKRKWFMAQVLLLALLQVIEVTVWCGANPEFSYLYFNPLVRQTACKRFDGDYWGMSYKNANRFLVGEYTNRPLGICYVHLPGVYNYWVLPNDQELKLKRVPYGEADYLVTNHRFEKESFNFGKIVFEEQVDGCPVITVYKKE